MKLRNKKELNKEYDASNRRKIQSDNTRKDKIKRVQMKAITKQIYLNQMEIKK